MTRDNVTRVETTDLECHQIDVKNAFTKSEPKEDIYISLPLRVEAKQGHVFKVLGSLYGLKKAARDWKDICIEVFTRLGFRQSLADPIESLSHPTSGIQPAAWNNMSC